jgi:hypothetical protein
MTTSPGEAESSAVLGFGGAWGFAPADLTSPANAAAAGAFVDGTSAGQAAPGDRGFPITELRVHGVSGSNGPTMLEHPTVLQVAGDSTTMFYRRWTPAGAGGAGVPWRLEAYSWGGLTEAPLAAASWVLLAPFMLYNVAHFMLPPAASHTVEAKRLSRDKTHAFAQMLLRVLALAATVQFTVALVSILVDTVAVQAKPNHFPSWLGWYARWSVELRVVAASLAVAAVLVAMWVVSVKTAHSYEARTSQAEVETTSDWKLTQSGFWKGQELVRRQRSLHAAAAAAATTLILSRPGHNMSGFRTATFVASLVVLVLVVVTLTLPVADRYNVSLGEAGDDVHAGTVWCRTLLVLSIVAFAAGIFTRGWPSQTATSSTPISGLTSFCVVLLLAQVLLLATLAVTVAVLSSRAPAPSGPESAPLFRGQLTTLVSSLAVCLGGTFAAVANLFAARVFGTPEPSGQPLANQGNALHIPWPIYAFAAAPLGLAVGLVIGGIYLYGTWRQNVHLFSTPTGSPARSVVGRDYGTVDGDPDTETHKRSRLKVAQAWAVGLLVDQAAVVAACMVAGGLVAVAAAEIVAAVFSRQDKPVPVWVHGLADLESLIGLFVAGVLVSTLRTAYSDPAKRKSIGAIWDVATFWPRATHPFAPPCYAERAVPELVDRIRVLTGTVAEDPLDPAWAQIEAQRRNAASVPHLRVPTGPLLLTGYSQGSILAPAVIAQLPPETLERVALLTLACPARRLYGRSFPGYFGETSLTRLSTLLRASEPDGRWKNLVRRSDYIGSWVIEEPEWTLDDDQLQKKIDQPSWDPVTLVADLDPTPPPIHRHSGWWPDPRVAQLSDHLAAVLITATPSDGSAADAGNDQAGPSGTSGEPTPGAPT